MPLTHWMIGTDQALLLEGLRDSVADQYLNDATVTAVLRDAQGQAVANAANIAFSYVAASDGDYVGTLSHAAALQENRPYTLEITAVAGALQRTWRVTRTARYGAA